jgi:hypothetical protein
MKRILVGVLLCGVALLTASDALRACYNDREVERAEREFRSQYASPPLTPPQPVSPAVEEQVKLYAPLSMGGLLLVGAFVQTVRRSRN